MVSRVAWETPRSVMPWEGHRHRATTSGDPVSQPVAFTATEGLRLRTTRRGPRVATGPRIARIHVGAGRAEGSGDHVAWSWLSAQAVPRGGGRDRNGGRGNAWVDQRSHLDALLAAHERPVVRARRPEVRSGDTTSPDVRWWDLPARLAGRRSARRHLDVEVAGRRGGVRVSSQADADRWWDALRANDEAVVLEHLDRCYRSGALPATPTAAVGTTASVVVPADNPERLIGRREPAMDEQGEVSLPLMGKSRRHELYVRAVGSAVLAVAAETFAVAPGVERVAAAVVAPGHPSGPAVIALCELDRDVVLPDDAEQAQVTDLELAAAEGRIRLVLERSGQARAPRPLPRTYPPVEALLDILDVEA
jgi:hypothetical protein